MRDKDDESRIKAYMETKMKHIKMYNESVNLADGLDVEKFAELVRADEREACAEICDGISEDYKTRTDLNKTQQQVGQLAAEVCGVRIRKGVYIAPPKKRSFSEDVGRLLSTGKGFYDDGTPIDPKEINMKIEGVGDGVVTCTEVHLPRPPKKEWVGLTKEEAREISLANRPYVIDMIAALEAKLKEKNT